MSALPTLNSFDNNIRARCRALVLLIQAYQNNSCLTSNGVAYAKFLRISSSESGAIFAIAFFSNALNALS